MKKRALMLCMPVFLGVALFSPALNAEEKAAEKVKIDLNFDEWEFVPVPPNLAKSIRTMMEKNIKPGFELKGPMYRKFKEVYKGGYPGLMVEEGAYKGKSLLVDATENYRQLGLHGPFVRFKGNKVYRYEVYLKGKGTFMFRGWVLGKNLKTSKDKWLGFPNFIKIKVTDKWTKYEGTFTVPTPPAGFKLNYANAAIVLDKGSSVYVDDFKIWENDK